MNNEKMHFRHCMLYEFNLGRNATQATKVICSVYGDNAVTVRTCQNWFERFRQGDFSLEDKERSGRPLEMVTDELEALLEEDPRQSSWLLSLMLINQLF